MCGLIFSSSTESKEKKLDQKPLESLKHRGPDDTKVLYLKDGSFMGFQRLAIMDPSSKGDQPFSIDDSSLVCNGEIYNFLEIKKQLTEHSFISDSDCEVILPFYLKFGRNKLLEILDGEFAFVIHNEKSSKTFVARDPMGIRPLFYGFDKKDKSIAFASEVKALNNFCDDIKPFPPGYYFEDGKFHQYNDYEKNETDFNFKSVEDGIHDLLHAGITKRLHADTPIGFLLSGGLDSSIVCAVAAKHLKKPITTFSVGIDENPIDVKYAKTVADYIKSDHHEVLFTKKQTIDHLSELIYHLETWDITTVRASVGMSLICKYIKENTNIKVVMTGEVSDELFGYKYTDFAPSPDEFQKEARKRIEELYIYDVLRADRCISQHSLEARVPFSDKFFVEYVMKLDPKIKMNTTGVGKYLLRKAFERNNYLPKDILYREKAAFSDAVGHSMVDWLKEYAESKYSDEEYNLKREQFTHGKPFSKESLLYREIFESHFSGKAKLIKDFWMPNKSWDNCDVDDPSARVLPNYGDSGN